MEQPAKKKHSRSRVSRSSEEAWANVPLTSLSTVGSPIDCPAKRPMTPMKITKRMERCSFDWAA